MGTKELSSFPQKHNKRGNRIAPIRRLGRHVRCYRRRNHPLYLKNRSIGFQDGRIDHININKDSPRRHTGRQTLSFIIFVSNLPSPRAVFPHSAHFLRKAVPAKNSGRRNIAHIKGKTYFCIKFVHAPLTLHTASPPTPQRQIWDR